MDADALAHTLQTGVALLRGPEGLLSLGPGENIPRPFLRGDGPLEVVVWPRCPALRRRLASDLLVYASRSVERRLMQWEGIPGPYVASRTKHAPMWRRLRASGLPTVATWIDEAEPGQTASRTELWGRIICEVRNSSGLLLYVDSADWPLKGAFVEAGAALGAHLPVVYVAHNVSDDDLFRGMGTWPDHVLVSRAATIPEAAARLGFPLPGAQLPTLAP